MSRIVVKNIPKKVTEDRVRSLFSEVGTVTDVQLKHTAKGEFRGFGFVGFKTEAEANEALKRFDNTFIQTSKIKIQICSNLGDPNKPRAWSKHSKESSAYKEREKAAKEKEARRQAALDQTKKKEIDTPNVDDSATGEDKEPASVLPSMAAKVKNKAVAKILDQYKDDPLFAEFFDLHTKKSKEILWSNDVVTEMPAIVSSEPRKNKKKSESKKDGVHEGDEDPVESDDDGPSIGEVFSSKKSASEKSAKKSAKKSSKEELSDKDYLKSMMADSDESDSGHVTDEAATPRNKASHVKSTSPAKAPAAPSEKRKRKRKKTKKQLSTEDFDKLNSLTLRVIGLPVNCNRTGVKSFFAPVAISTARFPRSCPGCIFVVFKNEQDLKAALFKHNGFYEGRRVTLSKISPPSGKGGGDNKSSGNKWEQKALQLERKVEPIADTGSLFVRNLAFTATEQDIEQLFSKYGQLSEVRVPIDKYSRKPMGFAIVIFLIAEQAAKAFSELDGTIFQGRNMHILPGMDKPTKVQPVDQGSSFKTSKAAAEKAKSGSSHNWNALFVGANAVADAVAKRYNTDKQALFDAEKPESMAVRLALGETQIVNEIREFLIDNGVELDAFGKANAERSKLVILVKNLPANVCVEKIRNTFAVHGEVGRVILPPSGITAVVEFTDPNEARTAFRALAYTKFENLPLYLEWAPVDVFKVPAPAVVTARDKEQDEPQQESADDVQKQAKAEVAANSDDEQTTVAADPAGVLYVKNLNFETRDEALKQHFEKVGPVESATVTLRKDLNNPGTMLSCGFGFVHYFKKEDAMKALKTLQHAMLDNHSLELKASNRTTASKESRKSKSAKVTVQKSAKIMVRNIPFEAKRQELQKLFGVFGELKFVRMPKKMNSADSHRGFGFVEFLTRQDAKRAFKALSQSTHLYGRHLVLEWANADETVDEMRKRTAKQFYDGGAPAPKKLRKSVIQDNLMDAFGDQRIS